MKKTGVVKSIRKKQVNGSLLTKVDIGTEKVSFFSDSGVELGNIEEGDKVEYKTEQNGQHTNLTEIELLKKNPISSGDKEKKKAVAMKTAGRVVENPDDVEPFAKQLYNTLRGDWD